MKRNKDEIAILIVAIACFLSFTIMALSGHPFSGVIVTIFVAVMTTMAIDLVMFKDDE